ncbi:hypothetical protein WJX72_002235 [[Myrmecia] bisecta]|uniref:Amino acid transporter transmembrane domain-containing protein n=1 Tax=[Myrmecia] bisecta TaxID=41462 RepID=A0AAW1PSD9_9CHLO
MRGKSPSMDLSPSTVVLVKPASRPNSAGGTPRGTPRASPKAGSFPKPSSPTVAGPRGSATESEAVFNMVNAILGAGLLGFPFVYRSCGLLLATLMVLLCLVASQLSMRLLLLASQLSGLKTYEDMARAAFGNSASQAVVTCVFLLNMGNLTSYVNILADVLSSVSAIIPAAAEPSRNVLMAGVTLFGALPVALLVRSQTVLSLVSQASVAMVLVFAGVLALLALAPLPAAGALLYWRWEGVLVAFPVVAYGFTAHQFLFDIFASLRAPTTKRMTGVVQKAMFACTVVYLIVGVCGYATFRQRTAGDILRNFGARQTRGWRGAYERLLKLGYGLSILGTVPLVVMPFHAMFDLLGSSPGSKNPVYEHMITTLVLVSALALALLVPNVTFIFGLSGSTAATLLSYVGPAAIFLRTCNMKGTRVHDEDEALLPLAGVLLWSSTRRKAWLLLLFGVFVGVMCTRATLTAVKQEAEIVALAQQLVAQEAKVAEAVRTEAQAVEVAVALDAAQQAVEHIGQVAGEAAEASDAAQQAAAALTSIHPEAMQQTAGDGDEESGQEHKPPPQPQKQHAAVHNEKAHNEAFALGAMNANLKEMKSSIDMTLDAFEVVTAKLEATITKLRDDKAMADNLEAARQQRSSGSKAGEGEEEQTSDENGREEAIQPGMGEAAAADEAAKVANEQAERDQPPDTQASAKDGGNGGALAAASAHASDTLAAIKQTQGALALVDEALVLVERAKGRQDQDEPGKRQAAVAMQQAVNATSEAAAKVQSTMALLQKVQVDKTRELVGLVSKLLVGEAAGGAGLDPELEAASASRQRWEGRQEPLQKSKMDVAALQQQLEQMGGPEGSSVNVTAVALSAVELASQALDTALEDVEVTVEQNPEVAEQASEIARELNLMSKPDEAPEEPKADASSDAADSVAGAEPASVHKLDAAVQSDEVVSDEPQEQTSAIDDTSNKT